SLSFHIFFIYLHRPALSTLFPYTTLFRSCVQTKSTLSQPKIRFETNEFYLRSSEEMAAAFARWPEALESTIEIAERCDVELELRSEEHTSELQSHLNLVCRLLLEKKN